VFRGCNGVLTKPTQKRCESSLRRLIVRRQSLTRVETQEGSGILGSPLGCRDRPGTELINCCTKRSGKGRQLLGTGTWCTRPIETREGTEKGIVASNRHLENETNQERPRSSKGHQIGRIDTGRMRLPPTMDTVKSHVLLAKAILEGFKWPCKLLLPQNHKWSKSISC
jgi:hypothetical protein